MRKPHPPTIFISYAREDSSLAQKLYADLKSSGASPWMDEDMSPGMEWKKEIITKIQQCDFFIALLSRKSVSKRGYVQKELKEALSVLEEMPDGRTYVIPARLEECSPSHPRLKDLNWVDLFPSWRNGIERILVALEIDTARKSAKKTRTTKRRTRKGRTHTRGYFDAVARRVSGVTPLAVSAESMQRLDKLKDLLGASSNLDALHQAIALSTWTAEEMKSGNRILLERDGEQIELILPSVFSGGKYAA